eukprot:m.221415 g.221415  ORF g.221415 m.221415 type:complete len:898 (-) comp22289_c0_seq5:168-2861(-)
MASRRPSGSKQREPVKVYLRIRPQTDSEEEEGPSCVQVTDPEHALLVCPKTKPTSYEFSRVFDDCTSQVEVFQKTSMSLVKDLLGGKNALLFTYGITNSGKTYTMQGTETEGGILSRSLDIVFNSIHNYRAKWFTFAPDKYQQFSVQSTDEAKQMRRDFKGSGGDLSVMEVKSFEAVGRRRMSYDPCTLDIADKDCRYAVFISYIEIYNENVYDLLGPEPVKDDGWDASDKAQRSVKKLKAVDGRMIVQDVSEVEVHSTEEAYKLLEKGKAQRQVAATELNAQSSRSHSVFNIRLVRAPLDEDGEDVSRDKFHKPHVSQFSLVDLAGSERNDRTGSRGDRQKEAGGINKSLMTLRRCMQVLRTNQTSSKPALVPYRDSSITMLFKNYFAGDGQVAMIACISPCTKDAEETAHVLKFAALAQAISTVASTEPKLHKDLLPGRGRARQIRAETKRCIEVIAEEDDAETQAAPTRSAHAKARVPAEREDSDSEDPTDIDDLDDEELGQHTKRVNRAIDNMEQAYEQQWEEFHREISRKEAKFAQNLQKQLDAYAEMELRTDWLENEHSNFKSQMAEVKQSAQHQSEKFAREIDEYTGELRSLRKTLTEQASVQQDLETEILQLQEGHRAKDAELHQLQARLADMSQALSTTKASIAQLEEEKASLQFELQEKDHLAAAEISKKEQEWRTRMGLTEDEMNELQLKVSQERSSKDELAQKLALVKELLLAAPDRTASADEKEKDSTTPSSPVAKATLNKMYSQETAIRRNEKEREDKKKKKRRSSLPLALNHVPEDHVGLTNTLMAPVGLEKAKVISSPKVSQLMSKSGKPKVGKYFLNHQENGSEHEIYKGEVERSVMRKGISVRFTALEKLTNETSLTPLADMKKRKALGEAANTKRNKD